MVPLGSMLSLHPFVRETIHDRVVGCMVGSALGDAIGLYTEFLSAKLAASDYPSRRFTLGGVAPGSGAAAGGKPTPFLDDRHRLQHREGEWTDDTDQALLILLQFLHNSSTTRAPVATTTAKPSDDGADDNKETPPVHLDPRDFAHRLKIWVDNGLRALDTLPLGLGQLVGAVVRSKDFLSDDDGGGPEVAARASWEETGRHVAPNGSLMRTHALGPACLALAPSQEDEEAVFGVAAAFSRVTHADPRCVVACAIGTALIWGLLRGEVRGEDDIDGVISRAAEWHVSRDKFRREGDELDLAELERHVDRSVTLDELNLDEREKIGYVYKTLGSGVVLLRLAMRQLSGTSNEPATGGGGRGGGGATARNLLTRASIFEELITELTMRAGDADTNACFAGALLGSLLGYSLLPDHWKHGLLHGDWLMGKCEALCRVLGVGDGGTYDGRLDPDTRPDGGKGLLGREEMEKRWDGLSRRILEDLEVKTKKEKGRERERRRSGLRFW